MSAAEALKAALAAGVSAEIDGDDLVLEASAPPPPAVLDLLSQHKAPIIAMLRWQNRRGKLGSKINLHYSSSNRRHRIATAMGRLPSPRGCRLMAETQTFLRSAWLSEALKYGWSLRNYLGWMPACPWTILITGG